MKNHRGIRKLAFQALYQLDARGAEDVMTVRESLARAEDYTDEERDQAFELAVSAYDGRDQADQEMLALAPEWPPHRQAAVDRAILRLAHHEMVSGRTHPKIAVNEAVELAKEFSTEKSPSFINGLLDKVLRRVLAAKGQTP